MRADKWIVNYLAEKGVTDVFGIPGAIVLDFLYAIDAEKNRITPHLCYHEQGAAFAACGYAQTTGKLGVAYATRGPGFTNMITAIADAYYDSVPTMSITAHSLVELDPEMRVLNNQEIDTVSLVKNITKKAVRIDKIEDLQKEFDSAYKLATIGRKGPVFIDFYSGLFSKDVQETFEQQNTEIKNIEVGKLISDVENRISNSKRPLILIGNGAREDGKLIKDISTKFHIPVLSSRAGQDIVSNFYNYFGFVGSRATRYSNFILSKSDLIISVGNRMAFPVNSKSFTPIVEKTQIIRIDIDATEFNRFIPNCTNYGIDSKTALLALLNSNLNYQDSHEWLNVCKSLKNKLDQYDKNTVIDNVMSIIDGYDSSSPIICDVGNHGFWITTAYSYQNASNRILYSGSFGTLGNALPKSIGAYYATRKPVVCFTGDQGVQFNIQELQCIAVNQLPITVVIVNNNSSGMIMEREIAKYGNHLVHTTTEDGYSYPNFKKIAYAFGFDYTAINGGKNHDEEFVPSRKPAIVELFVDRDTELNPRLPIGKPCQDLLPELPRELYEELDEI